MPGRARLLVRPPHTTVPCHTYGTTALGLYVIMRVSVLAGHPGYCA